MPMARPVAGFLAVDAADDETFPVQQHDAVLQLEAAEANVMGNQFLRFPSGQGQNRLVEFRRFMPPGADVGERKCGADVIFAVEGQGDGGVHQAVDGAVEGGVFRLAAEKQTEFQRAGDVVLQKHRPEPHVVHMDGGFGVEVHAPENAAEPEKALIFQPPGAAVLVDLHTQAVAGFTDIGGQAKVRRGEAVLGIPFSMKYRWISCGIVSNFSGSGDILWDLCTFFLKNMVKSSTDP